MAAAPPRPRTSTPRTFSAETYTDALLVGRPLLALLDSHTGALLASARARLIR